MRQRSTQVEYRYLKNVLHHSNKVFAPHLLGDGICGLVHQQGRDGDERVCGAHSVNASSAGRRGDPDASSILVLGRPWALFCKGARTHTLRRSSTLALCNLSQGAVQTLTHGFPSAPDPGAPTLDRSPGWS